MPASILVATPHTAFGELLRISLEDNGQYQVRLAPTAGDALKAAEKVSFQLAIIDAALVDKPLTWLCAGLLQAQRGLRLVVIPPENNPSHPALGGLMPHGYLNRPFYLPELLETVNSLLADRAREFTGVALPAGGPDLPPWLQETPALSAFLAGELASAGALAGILGINDDAPGSGRVLASAGDLSSEAAQEMSSVVFRYWNRSEKTDLMRYIRLGPDRRDFLTYATQVAGDVVLALVYPAGAPLSHIRPQARRMAQTLASQPPPAAANLPVAKTPSEEPGAEAAPWVQDDAGHPRPAERFFSHPGLPAQPTGEEPPDEPSEFNLTSLLGAIPPPNPSSNGHEPFAGWDAPDPRDVPENLFAGWESDWSVSDDTGESEFDALVPPALPSEIELDPAEIPAEIPLEYFLPEADAARANAEEAVAPEAGRPETGGPESGGPEAGGPASGEVETAIEGTPAPPAAAAASQDEPPQAVALPAPPALAEKDLSILGELAVEAFLHLAPAPPAASPQPNPPPVEAAEPEAPPVSPPAANPTLAAEEPPVATVGPHPGEPEPPAAASEPPPADETTPAPPTAIWPTWAFDPTVEPGPLDLEPPPPGPEDQPTRPVTAAAPVEALPPFVFPWESAQPAAPAPALIEDTRPNPVAPPPAPPPTVSASAAPAPDSEAQPNPALAEPPPLAPETVSYSFVIIPALPHNYLTGDLAARLSEWIQKLCQVFGWRLDGLTVRPEYVLWRVHVVPSVSPDNLVRIIRQRTSYFIYDHFPHLRHAPGIADFWAEGCLILNGDQVPSRLLLHEYIAQARKQQ